MNLRYLFLIAAATSLCSCQSARETYATSLQKVKGTTASGFGKVKKGYSSMRADPAPRSGYAEITQEEVTKVAPTVSPAPEAREKSSFFQKLWKPTLPIASEPVTPENQATAPAPEARKKLSFFQKLRKPTPPVASQPVIPAPSVTAPAPVAPQKISIPKVRKPLPRVAKKPRFQKPAPVRRRNTNTSGPFMQPDVLSIPTSNDLKETATSTKVPTRSPGLTVPSR